jgi:hypothetical protein
MSDEPSLSIKIDGRELTRPSTDDSRISLLLWGASGCGKTTLASTAPGGKLWLLFDPDGANSLVGRNDVLVCDLSGDKHQIVVKFNSDDPLFIERMLKDNPWIETVVFDSVTAFSVLATENAVSLVKSATIQNPGLKGYGHRNAVVLRACVSLMRLTKRLGKHIIVIAHEDSPSVDDEGVVQFITVALGGKMTNTLGMQLSEIWWMSDTGKERRIAVRNVRQRQPMKTRMFDNRLGEFTWKFDANKWEGDGISTWFDRWKSVNGRKIPLPT